MQKLLFAVSQEVSDHAGRDALKSGQSSDGVRHDKFHRSDGQEQGGKSAAFAAPAPPDVTDCRCQEDPESLEELPDSQGRQELFLIDVPQNQKRKRSQTAGGQTLASRPIDRQKVSQQNAQNQKTGQEDFPPNCHQTAQKSVQIS